MTKYADGNTVITTGEMFAQQFWAGFGGREGRAGRGGFWPEDDGTEKEFGGWEGREVADKRWGRGGEGGRDRIAGTPGSWLQVSARLATVSWGRGRRKEGWAVTTPSHSTRLGRSIGNLPTQRATLLHTPNPF